MKYLINLLFLLLITLFFSACQESSKHRPYLLNGNQQEGVNPNSLAYLAKNQAEDRKNDIALAKIDSQTKIEIEKIKSQRFVAVANVNKEASKETAGVNLEIAKIDAQTKEKSSYIYLYISLAILFVLLLLFMLWQYNRKKELKLQAQIEEEKRKHEKEMKEREFQEQRVHKILDLLEKGKLPKEMQEDVIASITTSTHTKVIESK